MSDSREILDVVIVGAGFSGLYALHRMRELGLKAQVLEAGSDIGGTWFWNRYPGARCDVESMQYSYSFSEEIQNEWKWTELYATQPEILGYINFVADKLKLRDGIQLNTRVSSAHFDEAKNLWAVQTESGESVTARFCIMGTGCLSVPLAPPFKGLSDFKGTVYRTTAWPKEGVEFPGQRLGLLGTGSTGIQITPKLAATAKELHVFQRTPNYSIPAQNRQLTETDFAAWKANYPARRAQALNTKNNTMNNPGDRSGSELTPAQMEAELEARWAYGGIGFMYAFTDITTNRSVNEVVSKFVRRKIGEIVKDPDAADKLTPKDYPIGAKRICVDTNYFQTFNLEHVTLEDIKSDPIKTIVENGVELESGRVVELDTLVLAIGFDAMTGALNRIDITGRNGVKMKETWADGPLTYFGLMVAGFPNMFVIAGPQSPSVFTNMVTSIEQHVDWVTNTIEHLGETGAATIEAKKAAQDKWVQHVGEVAEPSLLDDANSWYIGANVPGKPRVITPYLGGAVKYMDLLDTATQNDYDGFEISS